MNISKICHEPSLLNIYLLFWIMYVSLISNTLFKHFYQISLWSIFTKEITLCAWVITFEPKLTELSPNCKCLYGDIWTLVALLNSKFNNIVVSSWIIFYLNINSKGIPSQYSCNTQYKTLFVLINEWPTNTKQC